MSLKLYNFFHLNLAYSAIEEADRPRAIERCYWPLLRLAHRRGLPFGIELSGYTLECIAEIDPAWVAELRRLISEGPCELIGCGYAQVIGPLVPPEVTEANLRIGHQVYERLLGCRPSLALLNEQAYAAGLVPLYQAAGYQAIIMEWNNPARAHPEWNPEWRYLPQRARGPAGEEIPLIWNKSIAFQKFQRYVHRELELAELLEYVRSHRAEHIRALPLYGNDVEIFDFRPGRYMTEAALPDESEWARIDELYAALQAEPGVTLIAPSAVLELFDQSEAGQSLRLESSAQPTPVKKQDKYNPVRWAVSGRDDLNINTRCWRLFEALKRRETVNDVDWQELCHLWSSDFRTHITEARWGQYLERLERAEARWIEKDEALIHEMPEWPRTSLPTNRPQSALNITRYGRFLQIDGERLQVRLNCLRGLALDALVDRAVCEQSLCGTLHHGYFDDIRWGADYYSGHLVLESPGRHKITDLNPVEPVIEETDVGLRISGRVDTPLGPIEKCWLIDDAAGCLRLRLQLDWPEPVIGSLRLGHLTLMPEPFDLQQLCYAAHNGGRVLENFPLDGSTEVNHGRAVSFLISTNQAVGLTDGVIELGDNNRRVRLCCDKTQAALISLVTHHRIRETHFTRVALSAREMDDTSRPAPVRNFAVEFEINCKRVAKDI